MTLYLLKVHLQTSLSIPITQKCQILSCDSLVAHEQYAVLSGHDTIINPCMHNSYGTYIPHDVKLKISGIWLQNLFRCFM